MIFPCADFQIGLDNPKAELPFLSHAHTDHTRGFKKVKQIISTEATKELSKLGASITIPKEVKLYSAGHILGAKQIRFQHEDREIIYTGDFSIKENIFGMKAEIPQCDHLIFDATYGSRKYIFPDPFEIYGEIEKWVKENKNKNIIFGCYELGKLQEVNKVLNEIGITPIISKKAAEFNEIYRKNNIKLEWIVAGSEEANLNEQFVAIMPMNKINKKFTHDLTIALGRKTICAVTTGWAKERRFNVHKTFMLSNHCDYNDLKYYIEHTGAKKIEYFCGNGEELLRFYKN